MKNIDKELLSKSRAIDLWDSGKINEIEVGTFAGLKSIHKYLFKDFQDYYPGQIRNKNSAKGNFAFCKVLFIESNLKIVDSMPENTFDEIVEKYVTMNIVHPFRDGNARAMRI